MTHGPEWKMETNCMRLIIAAGALITCLPALTARAASELSRDQIVVAMGGHRHIRRRKMSEVSDRRRIDLRQRIGRWGQQRAGDGAGVERRDASW